MKWVVIIHTKKVSSISHFPRFRGIVKSRTLQTYLNIALYYIIMNDIYIDANVNNSFNVNEDNSDFTYKLAEPLELPKGTQISIQQSFINKKGITGGSIEIDEDIYEKLEYIFYITEQAHFQPVAQPDTVVSATQWARPTIRIMPMSFAANFDMLAFGGEAEVTNDPDRNTWTADTSKVVYGETMYQEKVKGNAEAGLGDGMHTDGCDFFLQQSEASHGTVFRDYGGNNMVLPQIQWKKSAVNGEYYMIPKIKVLEIFIPRGVYGIGQLGQMIEDYFNGAIRMITVNGKKEIQRKSDSEVRMDNLTDDHTQPLTTELSNKWDGQPYNRPTIDTTYVRNDQRWRASGGGGDTISFNTLDESDKTKPVYEFSRTGMDGFTSMDCYNELLAFTQANGIPNEADPTNNQFAWEDCKDTSDNHAAGKIDFPTQAKVRPFYYFVTPEDEGVIGPKTTDQPTGTTPTGQFADGKLSLYGYGLNGYSDAKRENVATNGDVHADYSVTSRLLNPQTLYTKMIGTANFSFEYNTEQNGFEIKGLHQVPIAPSHDALGVPNSSAGNQVINIKRVAGNALRKFPNGSIVSQFFKGNDTDNGGYFEYTENINLIRNQLNTPETRTSGIMILNWAKTTCENNKTKQQQDANESDLGKNFSQYFNTDKEARDNWKKTIWFKLGFDFDQIANRKKFKKQTIYNKDFTKNVYYNTPNANQDCGFTTDTAIDNTIITSVSTLNNPYILAAKTVLPLKTNAQAENFQIYGLGAVARPYDYYVGNALNISSSNQFGNSLYRGCSTVPVSIADVGGITANRLPTLTSQSYYLVTSDILDNFKDNVKKGEPLALMGVVAKTNLSNQDFIVDKNDITQVISQSKVINKIRIKILNPNLTAPILDENSSILIKITKPNIIPTTLLPPKEIKIIAEEVNTM
jgi:hypothetical protein